jgi:signal transduction histidine kinase
VTRRLLIGYLTLTVLVLAVLEIPLGISYARRQREELTVDVERDAVALASFAEDTLEGDDDKDLQEAAEEYEERTGGRVVIVDQDGVAVADSDPPAPGSRSFASRPEVAEAIDGRVATGTRRSEDLDANLLYVAVPVASGGVVHGAVRITHPTSAIDERVVRNWWSLGGVALATIAAASLIGIVLARSVARPLRRLEEAATRLGAGDLDARATVAPGPPEVRALAVAFNDTAARLQELVVAQEAFVADASHQLRTPLTALRLRLENLREEELGDADDLEAALAELARLSRMVDGLLALARADRRSGLVTAELLDVAAVVDERLESWRPVAAEQGVELRGHGPAGLTARGTPDNIQGALDNLLANALDASVDGDAVTVTAATAGDWVELRIQDEGPGMSPEQRRRAFDRFWRGGDGEPRHGGSGLGLSIARKLVQADGGEVDLRDGEPDGLLAVIRLPRPR